MSLAKLMALAALEDGLTSGSVDRSPATTCTSLRAIAERYNRTCPFKSGDLVTPCAESDLRGKGQPRIVLEVRDRPEPNFSTAGEASDTSSNAFGARQDMRVAGRTGENFASHWVESWQFEAYRGPGAEAQAV